MDENQTKSRLMDALDADPEVVIWPANNMEIPDDRKSFKIVYLGSDFETLTPAEVHAGLDELHRYHGLTRRQYRNGLAFVLPAARPHAQASSPFCYDRIALPTTGDGYFSDTVFHTYSLGQAQKSSVAESIQSLHARVLNTLKPHLLDRLDPLELKRILELGAIDCAGVERRFFPLQHLGRWFFSFPSLPKIRQSSVLQDSVAKGLESGIFGLLRTTDLIALDRHDPVLERQIEWNCALREDQITFEPGLYLADTSCRSARV